jgi:hypothetical protein
MRRTGSTDVNTFARPASRQVITDKHIYRLDSKSFKLHKSPIALDLVTGFSISAGEDQAVVIHIGEGADNDVVATLRGNACAAELVSLIAQQVDKSYVAHALCFLPLCFSLCLSPRGRPLQRVSSLCTAPAPAPSLPVNVNSKIYYHAQGKEVSLTFSEEEAKQTAFKRRGSGYALITRRASVMRLQVGRVRVWGMMHVKVADTHPLCEAIFCMLTSAPVSILCFDRSPTSPSRPAKGASASRRTLMSLRSKSWSGLVWSGLVWSGVSICCEYRIGNVLTLHSLQGSSALGVTKKIVKQRVTHSKLQ